MKRKCKPLKGSPKTRPKREPKPVRTVHISPAQDHDWEFHEAQNICGPHACGEPLTDEIRGVSTSLLRSNRPTQWKPCEKCLVAIDAMIELELLEVVDIGGGYVRWVGRTLRGGWVEKVPLFSDENIYSSVVVSGAGPVFSVPPGQSIPHLGELGEGFDR